MSVFGGGPVAAATLRARVLERLGAESEWTEGGHDGPVMRWTSGPVTTFFYVDPGPDDAPDLGVLRVESPVCTVGDGSYAPWFCNELNFYATTNRWTLSPGRYDGEETEGESSILSVTCSFVVGPHNLDALEEFVTWCVREQIASATAKMTGDIAETLQGKPCLFFGHAGGPYRESANWHEVVNHYDHVVTPGKDLPGEPLAAELKAALRSLLAEMRGDDDGEPEWYSEDVGDDSPYFTCEVPFAWPFRGAPGPGDGTLTATVQTLYGAHPHMGNGVLIAMSVPVLLSGGDPNTAANALNHLDQDYPGVTHSIGAWFAKESAPTYVIYLPSALATQDVDLPAVSREILLTLVRQALLARRLLLAAGDLAPWDRSPVVGLGASGKPHGLAWGETGEGRNPAAWYLDGVYRLLVGDDTQWAYPAQDGFTWWPHEQAQQITATRQQDAGGELREVVRIRVATEVRAHLQPAPETILAIAQRNASLTESALVLRDNGVLVLTCQLVVTEALADGAHELVRDLAVRQFVTARELAGELGGLGGTVAASAHPVSGPRPEPDWWFAAFEKQSRGAAGNTREEMPESRPPVALIAAGGQYALPYRMTAHDDGSLEFSWRPEHTFYTVPADPEIRVTATPGPGEAGPAWIIRSHLPVTGDDADKARWCNDRNAELLLAPEPPMDLMVTGGWGLTPDGDCCLTSGQGRKDVRDDEFEAARGLGYLLREAQSTVVAALRAAPEAVRATPLTAAELAAGLETLPTAFGRIFGERPDVAWATEADDSSVLVTCGELATEVPVGYGRPPLALVYGELLINVPNGHSWLRLFTPFPQPTLRLAFEQLEREGHLWEDEDGDWAFDAGRGRARLVATDVGDPRFGDVRTLRITGIADDPGVGRLGMTIPPAQFAWPVQPATVDVLTWVARDVIGRVREAARVAEQPRKPSFQAARPRLFGSGRFAAAGLRARLLQLLGAEPDWLLGDHETPEIIWNSGLATTVFEVAEGAAGTPDLGVLRVWTPLCAARNGNAARDVCAELNADTATARWSVAREREGDGSYYDEVQVSCAFVAGPHNADALESFALWCVREQIAVATAHIRSGDVADAVGGVFSRYTGFPGGDERADWSPVVGFTEDIVAASASLSADGLAEEWLAAFRGLRQRMFDEQTSAWFALEDGFPLTFETPFSWDTYPGGVITHMKISDDDPEGKPSTALVESQVIEHPVLGNGLRLAAHVPRHPRGHAGRGLNALNRLDAGVRGASHSFGGWTMSETAAGDEAPGCAVFLPAAFAGSVANTSFVMREIALTLARQALLARRVLLPADERVAEDRGPGIGLAVAADPRATFVRGPHGLAWGETGEGRNPAARVLDQIYGKCVGPDAEWADVRADGFTWWPHEQAQDISATLRTAQDAVQGVSIRLATEVRRGVTATPDVLATIASMNAELGQSALALRDDGLLYLALRLYVHEGTDHWANEWAKNLTAEQFITAREISARLSRLGESFAFGEDAVSAHPFSGMRPEPDELFAIREKSLTDSANSVREGLSPLVPLLGLCRLYALPVDMSAADGEGGLDFTWRVSQTRAELPVDPAIRVSVRRGDVGSGQGWIIRSVVPVAGDADAKARWCNDRNLELLGDGTDDGGDRTLVGGWGLTPDGQCCLTTWLSPFFVTDAITMAVGLVGNVISYHAGAILVAINADPGAVTSAPEVTPEELTRGLSSVLSTYAAGLEYPDDFRWTVKPGGDDVVVTLVGPDRTTLRIPLRPSRPELGWLYATFLGRSVSRVRAFGTDLIPGEDQDWVFSWQQVDEGLEVLDDEGLLRWSRPRRGFLFDADSAGATALLRVERLPAFRPYNAMALRLSATVAGTDLAVPASQVSVRADEALLGTGTVLGTWTRDAGELTYTVTIPPAAMLLGNDFVVRELVTWTARHVVTHVRSATLERAVNDAPDAPKVTWHDNGNGTGVIRSGEDVVASFRAQLLDRNEYPTAPPPDRRAQTQRDVDQSGAGLPVTKRGEELESWVAEKWLAQLDVFWMLGEPVFWCEHIDPDADEQPLMDWFMRFPALMACDECGARIRETLPSDGVIAACDSCGQLTSVPVPGRTPGMSIVANYELCPDCATYFTDPS